jgi:hypothetical protein
MLLFYVAAANENVIARICRGLARRVWPSGLVMAILFRSDEPSPAFSRWQTKWT